ncbi:MAG: hypothetical protein DMF92_15110 [Acidobacteria bacterium]|nr:MAG: hypothetical protein DMF92_15110 [Acidobacteriota bacterium]
MGRAGAEPNDDRHGANGGHVLLASAGLAAAYVILTTPPLRRLALGGLKLWLGAGVPAYLLTEVHRAWVESTPTA